MCGLEHKPWEAVGFIVEIDLATVLGIAIDRSELDPIKALIATERYSGDERVGLPGEPVPGQPSRTISAIPIAMVREGRSAVMVRALQASLHDCHAATHHRPRRRWR